jgi:hypothetical protein
MPVLIITAAIAGSALALLIVFFTLTAISVRTEDRRTRSLLAPPPTHLAAAARRVTGLYVRSPADACGSACRCHPPSSRAALGADHKRR